MAGKFKTFLMEKPVIWIPVATVMALGLAYGLSQVIYGGSDSYEHESPMNPSGNDPVYIAPTPVPAAPVVINSNAKVIELDSELLSAIRTWRIEQIKSKSSGGDSTAEYPSDSPLAGKPQPPVAPAGGSAAVDGGPSISVSMVVMDARPTAWLEKAGETNKVSVGDKVFGKKVSQISSERVCFSDKSCVKVY